MLYARCICISWDSMGVVHVYVEASKQEWGKCTKKFKQKSSRYLLSRSATHGSKTDSEFTVCCCTRNDFLISIQKSLVGTWLSFCIQNLDHMTTTIYEVKELTNGDQTAGIIKNCTMSFVVIQVWNRAMLWRTPSFRSSTSFFIESGLQSRTGCRICDDTRHTNHAYLQMVWKVSKVFHLGSKIWIVI